MLYKKFNVNPKGRDTSDCVVRALTIATGKDYKTIYTELFNISLESGYFLNEKRVEDVLLEREGFKKQKQPRKNDGTKYKVREILLLTNASIIVIRVAHHLTVVKDGILLDTWNCSEKTINNYYIK